MASDAVVLPYPLVHFGDNPLRWSSNKIQTLCYKVGPSSLVLLVVVTLYFMFLETIPAVTAEWHALVPNSAERHSYRDVGQGFVVGLVLLGVTWNVYKKRRSLPRWLRWLNTTEQWLLVPNLDDGHRASVWRTVIGIGYVFLYAAPGYEGSLALGHLLSHYSYLFHGISTTLGQSMQSHVGGSIWSKIENLWTENWNKKLAGYGASICFGRRPARALFDKWQLCFVERRITFNRPPRKFHPVAFQARYNDVKAQNLPVGHHIAIPSFVRRVFFIIVLAMVGAGWGILYNIAGK